VAFIVPAITLRLAVGLPLAMGVSIFEWKIGAINRQSDERHVCRCDTTCRPKAIPAGWEEELRTGTTTFPTTHAIPYVGNGNFDYAGIPLSFHRPQNGHMKQKKRFPEIPPNMSSQTPHERKSHRIIDSSDRWLPEILCREKSVQIFSAFEQEQAANPCRPFFQVPSRGDFVNP